MTRRGIKHGPRWIPHALLAAAMAAATPAAGEEGSLASAREVVERSGPAVALIQTNSRDETRQGSGFVVSPDGLVVTVLHLLEGAEKVTVSLPGGERFDQPAVLAFDVMKDLALLQVTVREGAEPLPVVRLQDGEAAEPGDPILVISNPLGLELTVTEGIVSAWREPREPRPASEEDGKPLPILLTSSRLLQISAAISPGSSGGPVLNREGEVIGVATAGVLHGLAGLNFAVPIDGLAELLDRAEPVDLLSFRERLRQARSRLAWPAYESALVAAEQGERLLARRHLERALRIHPAFGEALLLAGRLALDDGLPGKAKEYLQDAVRADAENPEAWHALGMALEMEAGDTGSSSQWAEAADAYRQALELDGRHAGAALALAILSLRDGLNFRAEELLLVATEVEPGMVAAQYLLGELYLQRDEFREAEDAFKAALWEDNDHAPSRFGLARVYYAARKIREAGMQWDLFLEITDEDPSLAGERERAMEYVRRYMPKLVSR